MSRAEQLVIGPDQRPPACGNTDAALVHVSGDLACTVGYDEGTMRIDGGEPFLMRIRVTHVLRRIDGKWRLMHRHADFPPKDQRQA